jgi:hypothetical protein
MGRTRLERETVIVWNEAEEDALVTTISEGIVKKLEKAGHRRIPDIPGLIRYSVPKRCIRIGKLAKKQLSPDHIAKLRLSRQKASR